MGLKSHRKAIRSDWLEWDSLELNISRFSMDFSRLHTD